MSRSPGIKRRQLLDAETNLCPGGAGRGGLISVCLVSPSRYQTGMSSLGFQTVYRLLAASPGVHCQRAFLPEPAEIEEHRRTGQPLHSLEERRPLSDFDLLAFSTSFEPDYLNIPLMLTLSRIPLWNSERSSSDPLVIAGGAAFLINPEPVADFLDLICIGEAEELVPDLVSLLTAHDSGGRCGLLERLSARPGMYVPSFFPPPNASGGEKMEGEALRRPIARVCTSLDRHPAARTAILTDLTEFGDMFLIEVSRGCPRGCRFCSSAFIYSPFRQQPYANVVEAVEEGLLHRSKIGLVGAAVSDYREIGRLCRFIVERGAKVSVSSLRIDRLDADLVESLAASGHRTIALAPEGGSQRMRDLMRKNLTEEQILNACEMLTARDILNLKLYFIIGLPTETAADLEELVRLVLAVRERVLVRARAKGRMGEITLSINPFIPKPFTPLQWCGMEPLPSLERKTRFLEGRLRGVANVTLKMESLKGAYLQALLSRGDRSCAPLLAAMAQGLSLKKAARQVGIDTDAWVYRTIPLDEPLPWGILGSADFDLLRQEYLLALGQPS